MGLEQRPFVGTWSLDSRKLVQYTPDALVFLNGDLTIPGCQKCSGRIDIQQYVTECSVEASTEPTGASANVTLSIPYHVANSILRDGEFVFHVGLEVQIYQRGYFPVKGLFANLAEKTPPYIHQEQPTQTEAITTAKYTPKEWADKFRAEAQKAAEKLFPNDPRRQANFVTLALGHSHLESGGVVNPNNNIFGQKYRPKEDAEREYTSDRTSEVFDGNKTSLTADFTKFSNTEDAFIEYGKYYKKGGAFNYLNASPAAAIAYLGYVGNYGTGNIPSSVISRIKAMGLDPGLDQYTDRIIKEASVVDAVVTSWVPNGKGKVKKTIVAKPRHDLAKQRFNELGPQILKDVGTTTPPFGPGDTDQISEPIEEYFMDSLLEFNNLSALDTDNMIAYPYYHVFHGIVTQVSHSYSGGFHTITLSCSSMLHFWEHWRISTSGSILGVRPQNSGVNTDFTGHNFTGMHPYQIVYALYSDMVGAASGVIWALEQQTNQEAMIGGESIFSLISKYWEKRFQTKMTRLRMHGATGELFSAAQSSFLGSLSSKELSSLVTSRFNRGRTGTEGKGLLEQAISLGLFKDRRLEALIANKANVQAQTGAAPPKQPTFDLNMAEIQAFAANVGTLGEVGVFESAYASKLDLIQEVCKITQFEFYQDVDGDFVFKPPMYNLDTSTSRIYCLEDIDIISLNFDEGEPQATYASMKGSMIQNFVGNGTEEEAGVRGDYIDYRLVAQFGWRPLDEETSYFTNRQSAFYAAASRIDVANSLSYRCSATIPLRPEIRPGYPVYIRYLDAYYYVTSVSHAYNNGSDCTTTLQMVAKRTKFFAPGDVSKSGIEAIHLENTLYPPKPLEVRDLDGRTRISGFPNVVMAFDPSQVDPLFLLAGSNFDDLSDLSVLRTVMDAAVKMRIIRKDGDAYVMDNASGDDAGSSATYFYIGSAKNNTGYNVVDLVQAAQKWKSAQAARKSEQVNIQSQIETLVEDISKLSDQVSIAQIGDKKDGTKAPGTDGIQEKIRQKKAELRELVKQKQNVSARTFLGNSENAPPDLQQLLDLLKRVSAKYSIGEGKKSESIALLDLISNKKATLNMSSIKGSYRYYSASHPEPSQQGQNIAVYNRGRAGFSVNQTPPILDDKWKGEKIIGFSNAPAYRTEAQLIEMTPTRGIRVLTSDPENPLGEVWPTNVIMEMMFSLAEVNQERDIVNTSQAALKSGTGPDFVKALQSFPSAAEKIQEIKQTEPVDKIVKDVYSPLWDIWADTEKKFPSAVDDEIRNSPSYLYRGLKIIPHKNMEELLESWVPKTGIPKFPDLVQVPGSTPVITSQTIGDSTLYNEYLRTYPTGVNAFLWFNTDFIYKLAVNFDAQMTAMVDAWGVELRERSYDGEQRIFTVEEVERLKSAWWSQASADFGLRNPPMGSRLQSASSKTQSEQTTTVVFPVSDAKGYKVVGSFRYGRGVDIDPGGVWDSLHQQDPLQMLDRKLIDSIVDKYVRRKTENSYTGLESEVLKQLRKKFTDAQLLDIGIATRTSPNMLTLNLSNWFSTNREGVNKIPLVNAALNLSEINGNLPGTACSCRVAEADVILNTLKDPTAFIGIEQAVTEEIKSRVETWEENQKVYRGERLKLPR